MFAEFFKQKKMAAADEVNFSVKVMINKEKSKVLFAEVDNDFADVLLSFLSLPLGTIVRLLQKHYGGHAPALGSLSNLYNSLANLDDVHFWREAGKLMLLNPRNPFEAECRKLKLNIDDTEPTKYFICEQQSCNYGHINMYYDTARCRCGKKINQEIDITNSGTQVGDGFFAIKTASFLISDDLRMVVPDVGGSLIQTLSSLGITDIDGAEQRIMIIGFKEIMDLLKGSLFSRTPLTDLILHKTQRDCPTTKFEPSHHVEHEKTSNSEKIVLKIIVQKSTNEFLFALAKENFIDFLLSFLTIPLSGVEWLLGSNSSLRNIDNLYTSSANLIKYLKTRDAENSLFKPVLAPMYLSRNQIFPLSAHKTPIYHTQTQEPSQKFSSCKYFSSKITAVSDPKGQGSYVRGPKSFILTDHLTITPLCVSSILPIISGMNIQLSDVNELEIPIGLKEGLSILKASLTSSCALTDGLNSFLMKHPKQERKV